jgi:hypothetical protein
VLVNTVAIVIRGSSIVQVVIQNSPMNRYPRLQGKLRLRSGGSLVRKAK